MVITPLITQVFKRAGGNGSQTYHVVFILTLAPTILRWDVGEGDVGVDTGQWTGSLPHSLQYASEVWDLSNVDDSCTSSGIRDNNV